MAESKPDFPVSITQFKKKLENRSAVIADRNALEKFRNGKCPEEHRAVCDDLIAQFDAKSTVLKSAQAAEQAKVYQVVDQNPRGLATVKGDNGRAAAPAKLGTAFHNPYTFLPFGTVPKRTVPTLLTADESDKSRFTGVLRISIRTLSPLLTCMPGKEGDQQTILSIGDDVVVPATGIRGALRTMLTVLTGGTLGYVDPALWLTQGRDLNLGPAGKSSPPHTPSRVFLARIVKVGSATSSGIVELNKAVETLVTAKELEDQGVDLKRYRPKQTSGKGMAVRGEFQRDGRTYRLSGKPVNTKGKREGVFEGSGLKVELPPVLWSAYSGRHAHADFSELKPEDLVWLEPSVPELGNIARPSDVKSIQWARWGRAGHRLLDLIADKHKAVVPDSLRSDGLVDEITNLFGQIPDPKSPGAAGPFAARVRGDNLVFRDCVKNKVDKNVQLAPLMQPHPGCVGFYRDNKDLDDICRNDPLRGYKIYRTTKERGADAPWHYGTQGQYDSTGALESASGSKVSRRSDLLREGCVGELLLSIRSLSRREVALLLAACSVDWRLGGGKPLGLGHCRVLSVELVDEVGRSVVRWAPASDTDALDRERPAELPPEYVDQLDQELLRRMFAYQATQRPVEMLRYPRAVEQNTNGKARGGMVWFKRHVSPRKVEDKGSGVPHGLQVFRVGDELQTRVGQSQVKSQKLPDFDPSNPFADALYGYDYITVFKEVNRQQIATSLEPFDSQKHFRADDKSGGPQGQSRDTRQSERDRRGDV